MSDEAQNDLPAEVQKNLAEQGKLGDVELHEDRKPIFRSIGLSKMNTSWSGPDGEVVGMAIGAADKWLVKTFPMAFECLNKFWWVVREPEVDEETAEILIDHLGQPVWKRHPNGTYIEDWTKVTHALRSEMMTVITSYLFEWEQKAANAWGEAMFSKGIYEEYFAVMYKAASGRAVEDREQAARRGADVDRMFGIYCSLLSRKADALIKSMERIGQRLKDLGV
jgi:hypothetical protein